jgi:hypothetical protein
MNAAWRGRCLPFGMMQRDGAVAQLPGDLTMRMSSGSRGRVLLCVYGIG